MASTKLAIPLLLVAWLMRGYECMIEGVEFTCDEDEFRCDNKQRCLLYEKRCDGATQCEDHTDEENCPERLIELLEMMISEDQEDYIAAPPQGSAVPIGNNAGEQKVVVDIVVHEGYGNATIEQGN